MSDKSTTITETLLINGVPCDVGQALDRQSKEGSPRKRWILAGAFALWAAFAIPTSAHAQFGDIFEGIFSSIQSDMGTSLKSINQITQSVQKLYQTTMWPLAAITRIPNC
jgi:hypothetical protein